MTTITSGLTSSQLIEVRWSTNPAMIGLCEDRETISKAAAAFDAAAPDFVGTARQVAEYHRSLKKELCGETFAWALRTSETGAPVTMAEVRWLLV